MSNFSGKKPGASSRENSNYTVAKGARSPQPAPRIGGKFAQGDNRSKTMTGNIKPQKGC